MGGPVVQPLQAVTDSHAQRRIANARRPAGSESTITIGDMPDDTHARGALMGELVLSETVVRYLTSIFPLVRRELAYWQAQARAIPDPVLRSDAIEGLSKRGNLEGAALFAVLAPRSRRRETVRALVAFQTAYNYLDTVAEQPSADPIANGRQLHQALLVALDPAAKQPDYYALHPQREDGGFLAAIVDTCRDALATFPSHAVVSPVYSAAAARIVTFQSLNLTERQGGHDALERWARHQAADGPGLTWWQAAAAEGSSLAVHALIATAANADVRRQDVEAIHAAYFPWICALHSLLDSLVDVAEDEHAGQRNLLSYHASTEQAASAMEFLAQGATDACRHLPDELRHRVILNAMVGYYLSSPEARTPYARTIGGSVARAARAFGPLLPSALALFKMRRALTRAKGGKHW
jgi:tetraprenyl-beta-curcumene synthase